MKELLVATGNKGKFIEIQLLLQGVVERLYAATDFPGLPVVSEDGLTFAENAVKKAISAARITGMPVIADDSGLVVDALGGRPGVHSARFAGEDAADAENNDKLLRELSGILPEQRTAAFHCVIALCLPGGECLTFDGELKGIILDAPRGAGGFGYDPLFLVPEFGQTFAELPLGVKNAISHRGKAFCKLKEYLAGA
ncbi:MAG TPA: XTP/dITP diphosphatase [Geobacteraceae bacterium]|nr:XTP/dITP diphosphatase [Geobacteraceae bacterium]